MLRLLDNLSLSCFGVSLEGRFRAWLTSKPMQDVGDTFQSLPIFTRYTLKRFGEKSRWNALYLHEFFRSDKDRCPHDHPWSFVTVILRGGYWEHTSTGRHWRFPGMVLYRPAEFAHRIEVDPTRPRPWSLVLVWKKSRDWGFYTPYGWRKWVPGFSPICEVKE